MIAFVSLQTSQVVSPKKCVETVCLPIGLHVFGLLDLSAVNVRLVDPTSELTLISPGVFPFG